MNPEQFLKEYETSDLEHTIGMIAEDAVYWFSDGTHHVGKQEVEAAFRHNFESIQDEKYSLHDVKWILQTEDAAVCIFRFAWSGIVRGEPASGEGRGTAVLKREGDSWRMAHEHLSKGEHSANLG